MGVSWVRRAVGLALVLVFALVGFTGSAAASATIKEFPVSPTDRGPLGITAGPDGAIWFTELATDAIGRSTLKGEMTEFTGLSGPAYTIVAGPDGNLWFAEQGADKIGRIAPAGTGLEQFSLPVGSKPLDIVDGPDGDLWFTEQGNGGAIGRITIGGAIEEFKTGLTPDSQPEGITAGPEGDMWFTQSASPGEIGRITPEGTISEYPLPTSNTAPRDIVAGADGNLWFTQSGGDGEIGRITPQGRVTEFTEKLTTDAEPLAIVAGNDGNVYFTEPHSDEVGEITPEGKITELTEGLTSSSGPDDIATGPDGNIWFTELASPGRIAVLTVAPKVGDTAATDVTEDSATLQASVGPNSQASTYEFQYGTTISYGSHTSPSSAGSGASSVAESSPVSGLSPDTEYHFRAVATNGTGTTYGPDETFKTESSPAVAPGKEEAGKEAAVSPATTSTAPVLAPPAPILLSPPAPPVAPPALGRTAVAQVLSGTVLIRLPGSRTAVPLLAAGDIPVGALVDAEHGTVVVTTAVNRQGLTQPATVWGGSFVLQQSSAGGGMTIFVDQAPRPSGCPARRHAGHLAQAVAAKHRETSTTLWSKDDNGHFSTRGQNSVATVRGTYWGTRERCDGTLTTVRRGLVSVRSLHTDRTVLVSAGHSYLARS